MKMFTKLSQNQGDVHVRCPHRPLKKMYVTGRELQQCSWTPLLSANIKYWTVVERRAKFLYLPKLSKVVVGTAGSDTWKKTQQLSSRNVNVKLGFTKRQSFKAEWIWISSFKPPDIRLQQLFGCLIHLSAFHSIVYFKKVSIKVQL